MLIRPSMVSEEDDDVFAVSKFKDLSLPWLALGGGGNNRATRRRDYFLTFTVFCSIFYSRVLESLGVFWIFIRSLRAF